MISLPAELEQSYLQTLDTLTQEHAMTYSTTPERWGIKKGREEGLQEGRAKGQVDLLLRLIERRFGSVPEAIMQRVQTADVEQLELWALNILDATSLDQVFRG